MLYATVTSFNIVSCNFKINLRGAARGWGSFARLTTIKYAKERSTVINISISRFTVITVEPVLSGPVLSGQLSKSRKLLPLITVILTSIKRSRSPFAKSRRAVSVVLTCIKWPLCKRKPLKYYSSSYKYK